MKCSFIKVCPTQNMTVLVSSPVPRSMQGAVAERLIAYEGLFGEQAGFREEPTVPGARARLQMMGGEFCGNASMSLAACIAREDGQKVGETCEVPLEVSGAPGLCVCSVTRTGGESFDCRVSMPLPTGIEKREEGILVRLPGIAHCVMPCALPDFKMARPLLEKIAPQIGADAVGLVLLREETAEIWPLVYVRGTESFVWERGCGSGSAAVGAMLAWRDRKSVRIPLKQPGGVIGAEAVWEDGKLTRLSIRGQTRIVAEGCAYVDI